MKKIFIAFISVLTAVQAGAIVVSAVNTDKNIMQNDYLTLYVGQAQTNLGRYQLSANKGNLENSYDDSKNLMYENFYSSYTTVVVNGKTYRFGEGEPIAAPYYDGENNTCTTVQKFGNMEVTQTLHFADGMSTGHEDMLLITYSAKNTGTAETLFGIRIMLDSQLDKDDKCTLTVDNALLNFEKEYKDAVPQTWSVVSEDGNITAYGKVLTVPDSIEFADWSSLFDKKWNYQVDSSKNIEDSAAALVWNNTTLSVGETKEYSVYYGVKNKSADIVPVDDSSQPTNTSTPAESSPGEDTSKPVESSQYAETSKTASHPVFTGENRGFFASAAAALIISASAIAAFFGMKKKGGSYHE